MARPRIRIRCGDYTGSREWFGSGRASAWRNRREMTLGHDNRQCCRDLNPVLCEYKSEVYLLCFNLFLKNFAYKYDDMKDID
jgi:hypothetical protein